VGVPQRRDIELRDHVGVPQRDRSIIRHGHLGPESHVLVGRRRVPVHPHEGQILRLGSEHFYGDRVATAGDGYVRDVELVTPERTGNLIA
jgi:hypothetical protein